jgi:hypothetical protein
MPLFFSLALFTLVPPNIDDSLSSSDIIVRENSNVTLKCRAHGSPQPTIKWKRDDNSKININKSLSGKNLTVMCLLGCYSNNFILFDSLRL